METYTGWRIVIRADDSSIGWMPENCDREASAMRYLELATVELERQYPGAGITAEYGPFKQSVDVYSPGSTYEDDDAAREIARDVEGLAERVFWGGDWSVIKE
jgi:hypothetical protein